MGCLARLLLGRTERRDGDASAGARAPSGGLRGALATPVRGAWPALAAEDTRAVLLRQRRPYLLEGVFKQRLPGHVDLYVTGQCIGLRTETTPRCHTGRGRRVCKDKTQRL